MATIWSDLKFQFQRGNMVIKLIMVNVAIHLLLGISFVPVYLIFAQGDVNMLKMYNDFLSEWFYLPSDLGKLLYRPWTLITYMFLHGSLLHLLFNMLLLYGFGRVINDLLANNKIFPIYFLGGLLGAFFFVFSYNVFPALSAAKPPIVGASAGVMAVVLATAVLHPHGVMRFIFIGSIELQYVAWFIVLLDIIQIPLDGNAGGHIAHLGGAFLGWIYIRSLTRGVDLGKPINKFFDLFKRRPPAIARNLPPKREISPTVRVANPSATAGQRRENLTTPTNPLANTNSTDSNTGNISSDIHPYLSGYGNNFTKQYQHLSPQECIDAILEKIKRSTYNSLSDDEKRFLERVSRDKLI